MRFSKESYLDFMGLSFFQWVKLFALQLELFSAFINRPVAHIYQEKGVFVFFLDNPIFGNVKIPMVEIFEYFKNRLHRDYIYFFDKLVLLREGFYIHPGIDDKSLASFGSSLYLKFACRLAETDSTFEMPSYHIKDGRHRIVINGKNVSIQSLYDSHLSGDSGFLSAIGDLYRTSLKYRIMDLTGINIVYDSKKEWKEELVYDKYKEDVFKYYFFRTTKISSLLEDSEDHILTTEEIALHKALTSTSAKYTTTHFAKNEFTIYRGVD